MSTQTAGAATSAPMSRQELEALAKSQAALISKLQAEVRESDETKRELASKVSVMRNQLAEGQTEINNLKDDLHSLTIENARLSGYRERVEKFDPVTEQQQYQDHHRQFPTAVGVDWGVSGASSLDRTPWYRRG